MSLFLFTEAEKTLFNAAYETGLANYREKGRKRGRFPF